MLLIKTGWWDAPLALQILAEAFKQIIGEVSNLTDTMPWYGLICRKTCNAEMLFFKCQISITDICWGSFFNPFAPVLLMERLVAGFH